jgi:hypothetical protein
VATGTGLLRMLLVYIIAYLKSIRIHTFLILHTYHPDTLYLREQGCEELWLFFEAKRGPRAKKFGKHCSADIFGVRGSVLVVKTRYWLDGPGFDLFVWARDFVFSAPVHTDPGSHPVSSILGTGALSLG